MTLSKRRKQILTLSGVLVVGITLWFGLGSPNQEPSYDSKPLSYWLGEIGFFWDGDTNDANYKAITFFGPGNIPVLVGYLTNKTPTSHARFANWLYGLGIRAPWESIADYQQIQWGAGNALKMMGADAEPALPLLIDAIHEDPMSSAWIGITQMGDSISNMLPTILSEFNTPTYRIGLTSALSSFTNDYDKCVPILIEFPKDDRVQVKYLALSSLRHFGTNAASATTLVKEMTTNANPIVSRSAMKTLPLISNTTNPQNAKP